MNTGGTGIFFGERFLSFKYRISNNHFNLGFYSFLFWSFSIIFNKQCILVIKVVTFIGIALFFISSC